MGLTIHFQIRFTLKQHKYQLGYKTLVKYIDIGFLQSFFLTAIFLI